MINIQIRPLQYRDIQTINNLGKELETIKQWYGLLKFCKLFPNPLQDFLWLYIAQIEQQCLGVIHIAPFNRSRSTWRVHWVLTDKEHNLDPELISGRNSVGSQLLRYCFEKIWEARTWIIEVNIHEKNNLALYRQNGFQPLAQLTYWCLDPEKLAQLAQIEPQLPNLLPVSNAEAQLLYQLDTVSMPPLLRQVFDRHPLDFKTPLFKSLINRFKPWFNGKEVTCAYVFEPQRKAAIAYFKLEISKNGSQPHQAQLTVHPAYTWLYPELVAQMAKIVQNYPTQALELASADYQSEREEFLEKLGATQVENTLLMSRSVWHKLREAKPLEGLQLSDVLKGLQPARTPIPSRMSWLESTAESQPSGDSDISTDTNNLNDKNPRR